MKVALVNPPQLELKQPKAYPPLGLLSLAAVLLESGIEVDVLNWADKTKFPAISDYSHIGVTVVDATIRSVRKLVPHLKDDGKILSSPRVIAGGPYPSVNPKEALLDLEVDCVITGEAEYLLPKIVSGEYPRKHIYHAGIHKDLNDLPLPARQLLPLDEVVDYSGIHGQSKGRGATTVSSSRGCSFHCAFCCKGHETYQIHRYRDSWLVRKELQILQKDYGVDHVRFIDDEFTLNHKRVTNLCRAIKNLDMTWMCITRADTVDDVLLKVMQDAGCIELNIGVETFSDPLLEKMNKGVTSKELIKGIQKIKKAGIIVKVYMMYGFPGETEEDRQITIDTLKKVKPDKFTVSMYTPLSGSRSKETDRIGWYYPDFFMRFKEQIMEAIK